MKFSIDTNVTFELPGEGRNVVLDALELDEFTKALWERKGVDPKKGSDGNPELGPDGKPLPRTLPWDVIKAELAAWIKEKTGVEIRKSEAIAIWKLAGKAWAEKNASWDAPEAEPPDSPTSPASTDPRYSD